MKATAALMLMAAATAEAASTERTLTNNLTHYLLDKVSVFNEAKSQKSAESKPKLKAYGYNSENGNADGDYGYELGINADLGLSYESPLYNQDQYLINRLRFNLYAGGRNYLQLYLGYIKLQFFFDVWGAKFTFFDNYVRYDIINYGDFCNAAQWYLELARMQFFVEIDVNECLYGLIGTLGDDDKDCDWATYYIDHPFWDKDFYDQSYQGDILENQCGDIPFYN